jgi:hypothetical protein
MPAHQIKGSGVLAWNISLISARKLVMRVPTAAQHAPSIPEPTRSISQAGVGVEAVAFVGNRRHHTETPSSVTSVVAESG